MADDRVVPIARTINSVEIVRAYVYKNRAAQKRIEAYGRLSLKIIREIVVSAPDQKPQ